MGLQAGFGTLDDTCGNITGGYWMDILDQREVEEAEMKQRGMHLPDWAGGDPANQVDKKPSVV
jgi:hypothetical protein